MRSQIYIISKPCARLEESLLKMYGNIYLLVVFFFIFTKGNNFWAFLFVSLCGVGKMSIFMEANKNDIVASLERVFFTLTAKMWNSLKLKLSC